MAWDSSQSPNNAAQLCGSIFSPCTPSFWGLDTGGGSKTKQKLRDPILNTGTNPTHLVQRVSAVLEVERSGNHCLPEGKLPPARGSVGSCLCWGERLSLKTHIPSSTPLGGEEMGCRDHDGQTLWML